MQIANISDVHTVRLQTLLCDGDKTTTSEPWHSKLAACSCRYDALQENTCLLTHSVRRH
jgi:hypothetical protein